MIEKAINLMDYIMGMKIPQGVRESLETAKSALEKQMPKKLTAVSPCHVKAFDSDSETVYTYSCVPCPVCSKWIVANVNHRYCEYCGQALDWRYKNE